MSISLPSSFRVILVYIAKFCKVWVTFSRYFLLDAVALACAIQIVGAYVRRHGHFLANCKSPQQLDCRKNWIYAYRIQQFSQMTIRLVWIYECHFCCQSGKLNVHFMEILQ